MKKLAIICGFLASGYVYAEACTPNYQTVKEACADDTSQKPLKMEITTERSAQVAYEKRSKSADQIKAEYCGGDRLQEYAKKWRVSPESIRVAGADVNTSDRWTEGEVWQSGYTVGTHHRFYCDYTASIPVFPKMVADNCPVVGAADANDCFAKGVADEDTVAICKKMDSQSQAELVVKGQCYTDALEAAKAGRIGVDIKSLLNYAGTFAVSADNPQVRKTVGDSLGKFYSK
jgi:hypothetical protein